MCYAELGAVLVGDGDYVATTAAAAWCAAVFALICADAEAVVMSMASADPTSARPGRPVRDAGEMPCEFQAGQRLVRLQRGIQLECWRCNDVIFWPPWGREVRQSVDGASEGECVAIYVHIGTDIVIDIRIGGRSRPWIAKPLLVRRSGCDWRVGGCTDGRCAAPGPCGNFVQTVQRGAALGQA
jgi:hypothetical protein